jgi:hypothetical protein
MTADPYRRTLIVLRAIGRVTMRVKAFLVALPRVVIWSAAVGGLTLAVLANVALLRTLTNTSQKQVNVAAVKRPQHLKARARASALAPASPTVIAPTSPISTSVPPATLAPASVPSGSGGYSSALRGQPGASPSPPAAVPEFQWPIVLPVPVLGAIALIVVRRRRSQRPAATDLR